MAGLRAGSGVCAGMPCKPAWITSTIEHLIKLHAAAERAPNSHSLPFACALVTNQPCVRCALTTELRGWTFD